MKRKLKKVNATNCYHYANAVMLDGMHADISGNVSDIRGNVSDISGNVSGIWGNVDDCNISDSDRSVGVDINLLVGGN